MADVTTSISLLVTRARCALRDQRSTSVAMNVWLAPLNQIALPVPRYGAILNAGGPLGDGDDVADLSHFVPGRADCLLRRMGRKVRKCAVRSRFSAPRVCRKSVR